MNSNSKQKHTVQTCGRHVRTGSGLHFYCHEVYALFDELIDRPWGTARWYPPADVRETTSAFVVELDVAGIREADVRVAAQDHLVVVGGERTTGRTQTNDAVHLSERPTGYFTRTFYFHDPIEIEEINHTVTDGVLCIVVPKRKDRREQSDE